MMKEKFKKVVRFITNPRLLLCLGIAWGITNGWAYILLLIGSLLEIGWMIAVASAYLAFLWIPATPEKLVTIVIAMVLMKFLFPEDEKTLGTLKGLHTKVMNKLRLRRKKRDEKGEDEVSRSEMETSL